jgi:hypothetical protein
MLGQFSNDQLGAADAPQSAAVGLIPQLTHGQLELFCTQQYIGGLQNSNKLLLNFSQAVAEFVAVLSTLATTDFGEVWLLRYGCLIAAAT